MVSSMFRNFGLNKKLRRHARRKRNRRLRKGPFRRRQIMYRPETMILDTVQTSAAFGVGWITRYLSLITRGDGVNQRNGSRCIMRSIAFHLQFTKNPSATGSRITFMVVKRRLPDGTAIDPDDIFNTLNDQNAFRLMEDINTYSIIFKRSFVLTANRPMVIINKSLKLNAPTVWKQGNSDGTEANCIKNAYYWVYQSDEPSTSPTIQGNIRTRWVDS